MDNSCTISPQIQKGSACLRCAGVFFILCALLSNVGVYFVSSVEYLPLFSGGALGWIAAGLVLFCAGQKGFLQTVRMFPPLLRYAWGGLFLIFLYHCIMYRFPLPGYLHLPGEELLFLTIPLLICLIYEDCRKLLLRAGAFLWLINIIYILLGYIRGKALWRHGITGNENWTAALLVMGIPFFYLCFRERCTSAKSRKILLGSSILFSLILCIGIGSKGAVLCTVLCGIIALFLYGKKILRVALIAGGICLLLTGAILLKTYPEKANELIILDGRILLYESTLPLIRDHAFAGTGQSGFENQLMKYRVPAYFFIFNPAARSNHPHNHFLYVAGCWGLVGLLCYLLILGYPLWKTGSQLYAHKECGTEEQCFFFTLLYALLHGSLDLIMDVWPTQILALTAFGILLYQCRKNSAINEEEVSALHKYGATGMKFAGIFLLCCGLYCAWQVNHAHRQLKKIRNGGISRQEAVTLIRETAQLSPGDYQVNFAFLSLLERKFKDPQSTLFVAEIMEKGNIPNYVGIRMAKGNALMRSRRFREAWEEYKKEAELFPFTLRPVYNMAVAARVMGDTPLFQRCEKILFERMKTRKLDQKDLYKILKGESILDLRAGYKPK